MEMKNYNSFSKSKIRKFKSLLINAGNRLITFIFKAFSKSDNFSFVTNANSSKLYLNNACFNDPNFFFTILLSVIEFLKIVRQKIAQINLKSLPHKLNRQVEAEVFQEQKFEDHHNYKSILKLLSCYVCNWQDVQLSYN